MSQTPKPVLLVEDNGDDVFFMRRAFKSAEMSRPLQVATDGQQAIDYLSGAGDFANRSENPVPSIILLDLKLPKKSGFEVLKWVREHPELRTLIVVVLTTSREPADIKQAYLLGANAYVVKPVATQLVEMLKSLKGFWFQFNEVLDRD